MEPIIRVLVSRNIDVSSLFLALKTATGGLCLHNLGSLSTGSLLRLDLQCGAVTTNTLLGKESQQRPRSRAAQIGSSVTAAPTPRVSVVSRTVFL